jgi:signal transduction histidine kinase
VNAAARAGETAFRNQEIAFSVCMAAVAILLRDGPQASGGLLWAFAALLAFNLGYHLVLRRRADLWYVPLISMAVNMVLVTAVLSLSGGPDSPFWPMYLIPIFTACLYLETRHVVLAAAASAAFLSCQYLDALWNAPAGWLAAELLLKASVLALSAGVTARHSFQERRARRALTESREELERLASDLERCERERLETGGGLPRLLAGLIYDMNGRLALIRGSSEMLAGMGGEGASDLRRIAESSRSLSHLTSDLLRLLRRDDGGDPASCDAAAVAAQTMNLYEHRAASRRLKVRRRLPDAPVPAAVGAPQLQQALVELLEAAVEAARLDGALTLAVEDGDETVLVRVAFEAADGAEPATPPAARRLLAPMGADAAARGQGRSCELVARLPAAARGRPEPR